MDVDASQRWSLNPVERKRGQTAVEERSERGRWMLIFESLLVGRSAVILTAALRWLTAGSRKWFFLFDARWDALGFQD